MHHGLATDQGPLGGLRVVWDAPGLVEAERKALEAVLTRILAEAIAEAFGRALASRACPGGGIEPG